MRIDYVDLILKIFASLVTILVIYWFFQILFGNSPSISQINVGLIIVIITLIVHVFYKTGKFSNFVEETFPRFEKNVESSFSRVGEDINELKTDMKLIKRKLKIQDGR